ncbi:hypothetical protein P3G55_23150 [Leptospira sp. 96542]|nr:hypothetical protein [Leptospira sp. 96542]
MRTSLFLLSGFLLLAASLILGRLFSANHPSAPTVAATLFLGLWLVIAVFNLWVGVTRAGYTVAEELPILALIFGVPAVAALLLRWKWL